MNFNIIITSSFIPSHPSIDIIKKTILSLNKINYSGERKIKVILAHDYSDDNNYKKYLYNLKIYCNSINKNQDKFNYTIVERNNRGYLVGNISNALKYVDSKYILIVQHDFRFVRHIDIQSIIQDMEKYPKLIYVRFNKRSNLSRGFDSDGTNKVWNKYNIKGNNNYISTSGWSDNNHLTTTEYYKNVVMKLCNKEKFMEKVMNKLNKLKKGIEINTFIYGTINHNRIIEHMDGKKSLNKKIKNYLNIYIPFKDGFFDFFKNYNINFNKYGINFTNNLDNSNIVLYLFNLGVKNLYIDKNLNLNKKFNYRKEIKNIEYFINLKKKLIIYVRSDGCGYIKLLNTIIKKYGKSILFIMRDYLLKEEKKYKIIGKDHFKYLIASEFDKKSGNKINTIFNNLDKYFCYTIPYGIVTRRSFLNDYFIEQKKKRKRYDVFYVKRVKSDWSGFYRKKLQEKLENIKNNSNLKIFMNNCNKKKFYGKLLKSKIMISVWGNGESLRDDNFCIHNDIIVLRVNTSHVKDFYNLFEENNIFHFFNINLDNLELKINEILNNYDYYYNLHNKKRQELLKKYNVDYHVKILSDKINESVK